MTEVIVPETAEELTFPTVHPEVATNTKKVDDVWVRRRVLIRDIICTRNAYLLFFTSS